MAYESPIRVEMEKAVHDIIENENRYIVREVRRITGIEVNKDELEKALRYDRGQYELGFLDGQIEAKKHSKWIPCNERLPKHTGSYLVTYVPPESYASFVLMLAYNAYTQRWQGELNVSAWMPLPEPYKEEADE